MHILRANLMWEIGDMSTFLCSLTQIVPLNKLSKDSVGARQYFQVVMERNDTKSAHLHPLWLAMESLDGEWGDLQRPMIILGVRSLGGRRAVNLIQKERPRAP